MKKKLVLIIAVLIICASALLLTSCDLQGDFEYIVKDGKAIITKYDDNSFLFSEHLVIPEKIDGYKVTTVSGDTFLSDYVLTVKSITISEGIETIESGAFCYVMVLDGAVNIPASVSTIEDGAFGMNYYVSEFIVSADNPNYKSVDGNLYTKDGKTLLSYAGGNQRENFSVHEGVESVGAYAFSSASYLKGVILTDSVKSIGDYSFSYVNINSIELPVSLESIGEAAFYISAITSINIPKNVSEIKTDAFAHCYYLTGISVDGENEYFVSDSNVLYSKDRATLIKYPAMRAGDSFTVPGYVTALASDAFGCAEYLNNVSIPNSVVSIGAGAFSNCKKLETVTVPSSVRVIDEAAFIFCEALKTVTLSEGLISIGDFAFYECENLESVNIPSTVNYIGAYAFFLCDTMTSAEFASPNGWSTLEELDSKDKTSVSNAILGDPESAAAYLTEYTNYYFIKFGDI